MDSENWRSFVVLLFLPAMLFGQTTELPDDFKRLLPRGAIPAISSPELVSAAEADIADDSWVLGVLIDGQPRAYSLNLLNHHEVVNDKIGDTPFAAVW